MAVHSQLGHHRLGLKPLEKGRHYLLEGPPVLHISGIHGHGDIDAVAQSRAGAYLIHEAGAGKEVEPGLMQRDSEHIGVLIEDLLHPVAMVGVYIDI